MLARVTTFEGGTADGIQSAMEELRAQIPAGPPPGVIAKGLTVLADADAGRVIWIGLFENEEALRSSEAALSQMNPPPGMGTRASLSVYEVAADTRV
jgi:hypothetical protein